MAVARNEIHNLIGRIDNDNRPEYFPFKADTKRPSPRLHPAAIEFRSQNLATRLERETGILWAYFLHPERACFTSGLLDDLRQFQEMLRETYGTCSRDEMPFRYLVWASRSASVWNMGGNLSAFTKAIREQDETGLRTYAYQCIDILYDNHRALDLPIMTVALVQGDAIGGGFEAMLTNDVVVAESPAKFGLPEILFNMFPGMGAHSFLRRKVGEHMARMLIEDGRTRSADEMRQLGLVDVVCGKGEGETALRQTIAERAPRFNTDLTLRRVRHRSDPIAKSELIDIVDMWVELALELGENDLRRMDCLARHQERRRAVAA